MPISRQLKEALLEEDPRALDEKLFSFGGPIFKRVSLLKHRMFGLFPTDTGDDPTKLGRPVETGNMPKLKAAAQDHGWTWKKDKSLFGGYWLSKKDQRAYEYDLV